MEDLMGKTTIVVLLTLALGLLLRFYQLDQIPNSVSSDEASFSYNAYSLLKTGRDEFGNVLPLTIRSFDDYKNPVYAYLQIPFFAAFGLSSLVARLPSALIGTAVILLSFLLANKLLPSRKLSLLTAFLVAISPWLIQYSRVAIDMEISVFFTLLGIYLYLRSKSIPTLLLGALALGLAFYSYHAAKLFLLLFLPILVLYQRTTLKKTFLFLGTFLLTLVPFLLSLASPDSTLRPASVSVFSNQESKFIESKLLSTDLSLGAFGASLVHNRRFVPLNQAVDGYLSIHSPALLFGQNAGAHIPQTRFFYLWQLPLIFLALLYLKRLRLFLFFWLLIGYLPGGLSIFPPFDRRIILVSFPLLFLSAYGLLWLVRQSPGLFKTFAPPAVTLFLSLSFFLYLHHYFVHGPTTVVTGWGNGMESLVAAAETQKASVDKVIVSTKLNQPLTFFLYYTKFPPDRYLAQGGTISGGFLENANHFDKYYFQSFDSVTPVSDVLYIWDPAETPLCLTKLSEVSQSDGTPLAYFGKVNETNNRKSQCDTID